MAVRQRVHVSIVIESVAPAHADYWARDIRAAVEDWFRHGDVVDVVAAHASVDPDDENPSINSKATPPMQP